MVVEIQQDNEQIHQFAAVVGLVKKCKQVRNVFDNAVLWFNDQFLFGEKANEEKNVTFPEQKDGPIDESNELGDEDEALGSDRKLAPQGYNPDAGDFENRPDVNDGHDFVDQQTNGERWGGCFIPNGFVHGIGVDDPYGAGVNEVQGEEIGGINAISLVKDLIDADDACRGCIFEYESTFFITDPNGHQWMIDKLTYPLSAVNVTVAGDEIQQGGNLTDAGPCGHHADRCEDDEPRNDENHCNDGSSGGQCQGNDSDNENLVTLREPIYTVHVQVDPNDAERQGFADRVKFSYRNGDTRTDGTPWKTGPNEYDSDGDGIGDSFENGAGDGGTQIERNDRDQEDADPGGQSQTGDSATVNRELSSSPTPPDDLYEGSDSYCRPVDRPSGSGTVVGPGDEDVQADVDGDGFEEWQAGELESCALEYNFLLTIDFEAFDNTPLTPEGTGENERTDSFKEHGLGAADEGDSTYFGNSHNHNPDDQFTPIDTDGDGIADACDDVPNGIEDSRDPVDVNGDGDIEHPDAGDADVDDADFGVESCLKLENPVHQHDVVSLDIFFYEEAPFFVEDNPYWDQRFDTREGTATGDGLFGGVTFGGPPAVDDTCTFATGPSEGWTAPAGNDGDGDGAADYQEEAVEIRIPIVCDVDADDGFHLHDGSQTVNSDGDASLVGVR